MTSEIGPSVGLLRMIGRQLLIEDQSALVASKGHSVGVQKTGVGVLVPDEVVAEHFSVALDQVGIEGSLPEQATQALVLIMRLYCSQSADRSMGISHAL